MTATGAHRFARLRLLALLVTASAVAAACGGGSSTPKDSKDGQKQVRVAFFGPLANTYVAGTLDGMDKAAAEAGGGVTVTKFDTGFDASKQYAQVQDAVTQGKFDAFIIIPLDGVGLVPAVQAAIDAGIQVVNTDLVLGPVNDSTEPQVKGQLGTVVNPPKDRAARTIEALVAACKDLNPCNLGYMAGEPSFDFEALIKKHLDTLSSEYPNIKVKSYQSGHGYVAAPAIGIAQNMLQANPDLNVLGISSDQAAAGAEQSVQDAGKAGKIRIVSSGGSCPAVDAVKAGRWFATVIDMPRTEGYLGMKMVVDAVRNGKKDAKGMNPIDTLKRDPFVTKDNAEGFECEWQG